MVSITPALLQPVIAAIGVAAAAFTLRALLLSRVKRATALSGLDGIKAFAWDARIASLIEVVVPNARLAQSILTNYSVPTPETSVGIKVGVTYRCDPERVRRILEEEATGAVGKISGLLGEPRPSVALIPGFEGASLTFTLDYRVARFTDQWAVQDGLRRRILRRFMEEGVEMAAAVADGHGQSLARSL